MHHGVGQDLHRLGGPVSRHVDPINGPIKTGVGIDVAALFLHLPGNFPAAALVRAFEEHVFENVGQSRSQPFALVNTAGAAPGLHTGHRCAVIFFHNESETILQRENLGLGFRNGRSGRDGRFRLRRGGSVFRGFLGGFAGNEHHKREKDRKRWFHKFRSTAPEAALFKYCGSGRNGLTKTS